MKPTETVKTKEYSLVYFLLTTSLCFFSFSALLELAGDGVPHIIFWIAFISLFSGLFCGDEKIISWERKVGEIINDFSLYITN